jgi:ParB family chromosome partitioning protein
MSLNFSSMKGENFTMTEQTPTYIKGSLYQISCADLQTDPNQPRKYFDPAAQQDLVDSIRDKGVIQPVLFRVDQKGILFIVAGERRLQAAKEVGLEKIPAILVEDNPDEITLVENILRQDLTPLEVAEGLDRMMKIHGYSQQQLTTIIGKAKSTVSETLSLNRLPKEIKDKYMEDPKVSRKALIEILKKKKTASMLNAYKKYEERSSKPPKPRGPKGKRRSLQEKFTFKYEEFTTFVTEMDFGTLDIPARTDLISRIEDLKKTVDILIAQIQSAPVKETPPPKAPAPKKVTKDKKKPVAKLAPKPKKEKKGKKPTVSKPKK